MPADCRNRIRERRSYEGTILYCRNSLRKGRDDWTKEKQKDGRVSTYPKRKRSRRRGYVRLKYRIRAVLGRASAQSYRGPLIFPERPKTRIYCAKVPTRSREERARKRKDVSCTKQKTYKSERSIVRIYQRRTGLAGRVRAVEHRGYILRHTVYAREPPPTWTHAAVALKYRTRTNFRENETINDATRRSDTRAQEGFQAIELFRYGKG